MCIEFLGYPSYCLLVPKQCRLESRPMSLFQMSHLWMQSATWSHTCAVSSVEGTRCFFRAHFRLTSEIGRADMPSEVVWLCFGLGVYAFGNGPHSPSLVSMFRVRAGSDCDVERSRLVRIPECGRKYMLSSLWFGLGLYAFGMNRSIHLAPLCVTVTARVHAVVCYHSFVYWVSELSPLPQLSVGEQHSKVNNSTSPLFLVAIFKACFCWYPFSLYPPSSFLIIIFWAFGYLLLSLILNISLSHS